MQAVMRRRSYSPRRSQGERLRLRFRFRRCGGGLERGLVRGLRHAGQDGFKLLQELGDVAPGDDERRKQPKDVVVGAIDQQPQPQRFGDEGSAFDRQINAENQPFAAHFADEVESRRKSYETSAELGATLADIQEKIFLFNDGEKFERGGADQRATAKSRAVHSRA